MYKLLIILRYLRRKLVPMFATLAVTLCTAMVIIVISVMGGFLDMMRGAVRTLEGDVIISADVSGFPHYDMIAGELKKLPKVLAVAPLIRSYGLVSMNEKVHMVEVMGIDPVSLNAVVDYQKTLHWTKDNLVQALEREVPHPEDLDALGRAHFEKLREQYNRTDLVQLGMTLQGPKQWGGLPGMVPGIHVSPYNRRNSKGQYDILNNRTLGQDATLTVVPLTGKGAILEPVARKLVVVNEFKSGLYEIDANRVFVPFAVLQKMLRMDAGQEVAPDTGQATGREIPARCSALLIRGQPGTDLLQLREAVLDTMRRSIAAHPDLPAIYAQTWEEKHGTFLGAVAKEKFLLTILFAIISVVAVAMIAVIFYMIVLEKTRDIGVLRALGASRRGIAAIFLGYGLAIGIIGAGLGLALAATVVININAIQDFLTRVFGLTIWNPEIYYFDRVPNHMNPHEVAVIVVIAILASVAGSLIPAVLAARLNPVESLRYE